MYRDLREQCVSDLTRHPYDGFAVGGLGVGEGETLLSEIAEFVGKILPEDRPRYLMGVGRPQDLIFAVQRGYDLFDCVLPTRNARNGTLFTSKGKLSIKRAEFSRDPRPLDDSCNCYCCQHFSRAYLRHIYLAGEILAAYLHTLHNLYFYHRLMERMREAIKEERTEFWLQDSGFEMQDLESE
jgi:queuine tRNA-ribosyltransferase